MLIAQYAMEYADAGFIFLCVSPGVSRLLHEEAVFSFD